MAPADIQFRADRQGDRKLGLHVLDMVSAAGGPLLL
jgi:hypothetical protein